MGKGIRYSDEFKQEAVNQISVHGYSVYDVAERLGISTKALYGWLKKFSKPSKVREEEQDLRAEIARLKRELKRTEQERNILKEGRGVLCLRVKERYRFIRSRCLRYPVRMLCRLLSVHPSGYYDWLKSPVSKRELEDKQLSQKIKQFWLESGGVHGYRNIYMDFRDANQYCGRDRILRLMQKEGLRAQRGYDIPRGYYGGKVDIVAGNELNREFNVEHPNQWWVTDITYIKTHEGFLFLAVVMDLYARNIVGWSMSDRMTEDLAMQAVTAAYWRRKPKQQVNLHSDQGSQYSSRQFRKLLDAYNIKPSMSRRGNCHDNAVAESFFSNLKKEKIRRRIYPNRAEAKQAVFHYIEMVYNPIRRHTKNGRMSPNDFERKYFKQIEGV
ncbi:IS3 family transposase [Catenovulum sp. 2E275]|uniref:IS3 family transposase n=1 Tax=Catenovulum sp. 2E275 TaxID=2980497 RepID=UPI0021D160BF|nr:IS3 family transposase [Catenovulum sp. 2E275]MCU4677339.1 IS3 family transposase [Catenovulum sp. 2E275]